MTPSIIQGKNLEVLKMIVGVANGDGRPAVKRSKELNRVREKELEERDNWRVSACRRRGKDF
jgi:hypothetical protein